MEGDSVDFAPRRFGRKNAKSKKARSIHLVSLATHVNWHAHYFDQEKPVFLTEQGKLGGRPSIGKKVHQEKNTDAGKGVRLRGGSATTLGTRTTLYP